jgi:ATP-dependent protease HslVU (ClpYQ) peptidase subunit
MTTVTFKDGIMAADSRQSHTYIDQVEAKKIYIVNGDVIGLAGSLADFPKFLKWYKQEKNNIGDIIESKHEITNIEALVHHKGKLYHFDENCIAIPMGNIAAIGSGGEAAMGAMLAGVSAPEAVKIACQLDMYSSEPIKYVEVENPVKRLKVYRGLRRKKT